MVTAAAFREQQARAMSEDQLEEAVRDLCKVLGVVRVHQLRSRGTTPGWPDDALIGTTLLLRELKKEKGIVSPAQRDMHEHLRRAGVDVDVWRPSDLTSGRIEAELRAISPRGRTTR